MGDGGIRVEGNHVIDDASWKTGARRDGGSILADLLKLRLAWDIF